MISTKKTIDPIVNAVPAVLYKFLQNKDGFGKLLYISPMSDDILGYPSDFFMEDPKHFWEIIHTDDVERLKNESKESLSEDSFCSKARIVLPSGEIRWIRFHSAPGLCTIEGEVIWNGCIVDITDLVKAEKKIKRLRGILPLCSFCKKIRNEDGEWENVDIFIFKNTEASISHGVCNECMVKYYSDI